MLLTLLILSWAAIFFLLLAVNDLLRQVNSVAKAARENFDIQIVINEQQKIFNGELMDCIRKVNVVDKR